MKEKEVHIQPYLINFGKGKAPYRPVGEKKIVFKVGKNGSS